MTDVGDIATATLTVSPFGGGTNASLTVHRPDGTTTTPSATSGDGGKTWTAQVTYSQAGWWLLTWTVTGTGAGVQHQRVFVGPAPDLPPQAPLYASPEKLKKRRRKTDDSDDDLFLDELETSSRAIDGKCHRVFYRDTTASARVYNGRGARVLDDVDGQLLLVDDIADLTGLLVETSDDATTWTTLAATDYRAEPGNALARKRPVTQLRRLSGCWTGHRFIRVTAVWGWPAVPPPVVTATLLLANRLVLRKDSPEGVAGSSEWGVLRISRWDPDVEALLAPFVLPEMED